MFKKKIVLKLIQVKNKVLNILSIESYLPKLTNKLTKKLDDMNQVYNLKLYNLVQNYNIILCFLENFIGNLLFDYRLL